MTEKYIYSVCQQCNTNCGIKVRLEDGIVKKISGNPYSPWTLHPPIPYTTPTEKAIDLEGALCPKGYAGIQTLYDPYRIKKVLKRVGKRGENKWQSVDFQQAIKEIVRGGDLFGEGHVDGLKDIATLLDPILSKKLAHDAKLVAEKKLSLEEFQQTHKEHLHHLIDPNHPDLGPKNNQICYSWGRQKGGRTEFIKRFFNHGLGTVNTHGHTTVCQGSLYFTCKAMSDQFVEGTFKDGKKFYWQTDNANAEFILFVGANPLEANYGPPLRGAVFSEQIADKTQKIAVADPRLSKTAAKAWKWLPIKPDGVAALGMGMIAYILQHHAYDLRYLENCNKAAARLDGEPTWSQGAWLVKIDNNQASNFLRASDLDILPQNKQGKNGDWKFDAFVSLKDNTASFFDPNDEETPVHGELFVDTVLNGHHVKSVLQIYKEEAEKKSLQAWAEEAGISEKDLIELTKEFCSHGKKSVVDIHRGVSQHTNGFYNVAIFMFINTLMGNFDWQGGLIKATTYSADSSHAPFPLNHNEKQNPWGISLIRNTHYEKTTLFQDYPAKRPWYPFASDIYQEIIPSAGDMYPYQVKALFLYMAAPTYSLPAGYTLESILEDNKKIPLIIANDITVGETSRFADYIFPDVSYLERWEFTGSHPSQASKVAPVRQPVVAPLTENICVYNQEMPINLESMLLAIAEQMNLVGFGENAFTDTKAFTRQEDFYLRMLANLAFGENKDGSNKIEPANQEEIQSFIQAREHLPRSIFCPERWENIVGKELWPHVVTLLNRGGRFESLEKAYKDNKVSHAYGKMVNIYFENLVNARSSMTGKKLIPYAHAMESPLDCMGNNIIQAQNTPLFHLVTYKTIDQCKSRTGGNYWLKNIQDENFIEISANDATELGLQDGDVVTVYNASSTIQDEAKQLSASVPTSVSTSDCTNTKESKKPYIIGKIKIRQGLRPKVIAISHGFGLAGNGASDMFIDGHFIKKEERRTKGVSANPLMNVDPVLQNTCLSDPIGASAVFCQSMVYLNKN